MFKGNIAATIYCLSLASTKTAAAGHMHPGWGYYTPTLGFQLRDRVSFLYNWLHDTAHILHYSLRKVVVGHLHSATVP